MSRTVTLAMPRRHSGQRRLALEARRFNIACMGRRWGKTTFGLDLLIAEPKGALDGLPVAWFAPTYKLLDEVWRDARRLLRPLATRIDSQQHRIEMVTGGALDFWTLDDPDAGRGRKYARIVIDEAAMARYLAEAWQEAIRPTLTDYQGSAWFFSTPKGTGNEFARLYREAEHAKNWARWQMPTASNPHIAPDEIEAARYELPSLVFQQEYLAQFIDSAGAVVKREWLRPGVAPEGCTVVMGVDLALSQKDGADYTAAVVLARAPDGALTVLDVQRTRAPFHQVLNFVRAVAERHRPSVIAIEAVQYQAAVVQELLRTTTLPVRGVKPDKDKMTRFLPLQARYEQGQVGHTPGLIPEFEDELLSFPVGAHDDMVDALAYAFAALPATGPQIATAGHRTFGGSHVAFPSAL